MLRFKFSFPATASSTISLFSSTSLNTTSLRFLSSSTYRPDDQFGDSTSEIGSGGIKFTPQGLKSLNILEADESPIVGTRKRMGVRTMDGMSHSPTVLDPAAQPLLQPEDHEERARRIARYKPVSLATRQRIVDDSPHKVYHKITPEHGFGARLDDFIKELHPDFSRETITKLVENGHIYKYNAATGRKHYGKLTDRLTNGEMVVVPKSDLYTKGSVFGSPAGDVYESLRTGSGDAARDFRQNEEKRNEIHLSYKTKQEALDWVLFKNPYIVVINKPPGVPINRTADGSLNIADMLGCWKFTNTNRPLICNNLDRDTSGLVVLARNHDAHRMLGKTFQKRLVPNSTYWSMLVGTPKAKTGRIKMHLEIDRASSSTIARLSPTADSQVALSEFVVNANAAEYASFVSFYPLTSRPNQLRIMAAHALRCPIIGDARFGGENAFPENLDALLGNVGGDEVGRKETKMMLHFRKIQLPYKKRNGEFECVNAPIPNHMKSVFHRLGWPTNVDDPLIPG